MAALRGVSFRVQAGELVAIVGPVRVGQVDAPASDGDARASQRGAGLDHRPRCRRAGRPTAGGGAGDPDRVRLPAVLPGRARERARERRRRAPLRRRPRARATRASSGSARPGRARRPTSARGRRSCPAGSGSGWRSPRALVGRPAIVLADEPTGNLDSATGQAIMDLIEELHAQGATIVVITHEHEIAARIPRQIALARRPDRDRPSPRASAATVNRPDRRSAD